MRHCGIQQPRGELPELRRVRRGCHARPWLRPGVQEDQLPGPAAAGHVAEERVDDLPDDAAPVGAEPRVRRHGPGHARRRRPPPPPRGPRERPARRYNLPSIFAPSNSHQVKRLGSSWAYSTGRTKSRARRVVAFIRERHRNGREPPSRKSRSRRLTPEGMNYICSHPLQRRFDGQQLGPGSYHPALAMNGRLISRRGL